ncbi:MAG TPA: DUF1559 domain-containing protein [Planctomycetaceae bacterium]|jgi:hypothetical protein|nr:DUF1559 domain-containing protein [Planctomycetaceae bacterium]
MLVNWQPDRAQASRCFRIASIALLILSAANAQKFPNAVAADPELPAHDPEKTQETRENLKALGLAMSKYQDRYKHFPPAVVIGPDGKTPHSWRVDLLPFLGEKAQRLYAQYRLDQPWDSPSNKKVLAQMPDVFRSPYDDPKSTNSAYYVLVGPGTVFEIPKGIAIGEITDGTELTLLIVEAKRDIPWTKPADIPYDPKQPIPMLGGFFQGAFGITMADGSARIMRQGVPERVLRLLIARNDGQDPEEASRESARESEKEHDSQNKLKQLALAMHNYHDVHGHFPPAVVMGPDGKTPHSWRVELLPFLDEKRLYDEYRLNEPWDSPHNKVILRNMPNCFRSPFADEKSTNSSYYALVGKGTIFQGKDGMPIRDITDGTSNTLMFVEAKRDVPWTKPADIPFDPGKPVPPLGGYVRGHFTAACADGASLIFELESFKGDDLKWAIMRNDGHPFAMPPRLRN